MLGTRVSVLMTVYNRPEFNLRATLHALRRNDLIDTEIIIVNDGSTQTYDHVKNYIQCYELPVKWIDVNTVEDRPGTYHIDGYNNPSYAWNTALEASRGDVVVVLSSDCLVPPHGLTHARMKSKDVVWMSCVVDMDTATVYLGRARVYPMGWLMAFRRADVGSVRWDEELLKGIDYDDNDITAQLALQTKRIEIDAKTTVFHQSHPSIAYSDGGLGHDINNKYMKEKWGGIPWAGHEHDALEWSWGIQDEKIVIHCDGRKKNAVPLKEQHGFG